MTSAMGRILSPQPDSGFPAYDSIPVGPQVIAGLFQGWAIHTSGFSIFPIASLAMGLHVNSLEHSCFVDFYTL